MLSLGIDSSANKDEVSSVDICGAGGGWVAGKFAQSEGGGGGGRGFFPAKKSQTLNGKVDNMPEEKT